MIKRLFQLLKLSRAKTVINYVILGDRVTWSL